MNHCHHYYYYHYPESHDTIGSHRWGRRGGRAPGGAAAAATKGHPAVAAGEWGPVVDGADGFLRGRNPEKIHEHQDHQEKYRHIDRTSWENTESPWEEGSTKNDFHGHFDRNIAEFTEKKGSCQNPVGFVQNWVPPKWHKMSIIIWQPSIILRIDFVCLDNYPPVN